MSNDFSADEKTSIRAYALSRPQGSSRTTCPACSTTRRNKRALCLSVTVYPERVVMQCHHCERQGATYLKDDIQKPFVAPVFEKVKPTALKRVDKGLTEAAIEYLSSRSISLNTAQVFELVSSRAYFPELQREEEAINFPYYVGKKVFGNKVRSHPDKAFVCDKALGSLFGIQNVDLAESGDILICEGEFDPISFYEAGVINGTSVPNGSGSFKSSNPDGTMKEQLGFLWDARTLIDKAKRILIAVDADEPGEKLAEELARRIGKHRCWRVAWPEGCKDANDVLVKHGKEKLAQCVAMAESWPVAGLFEAANYFDQVDDYFENGFGDRISTGMSAVDELFSVAPGMLTILTGNPNSGKSTWVDQVVLNLARKYGHITAMCSFENAPAIHIGKLASMLTQTHFFDDGFGGKRMSRKELDAVKPFIHRHIKFLSQDDGQKATVESIIERIKTAVFRWGVKVVVIDPYNYVYRPPAENETSFIDDMLTKIRLTAALYGIHIFFICHPRKMEMLSDGTYQVPKGYSIAGSAAFFSKPDFGITVHRKPDSGEVEIHVWKVRYDFMGTNGMCKIHYDKDRHVYISDNYETLIPYEPGEKR